MPLNLKIDNDFLIQIRQFQGRFMLPVLEQLLKEDGFTQTELWIKLRLTGSSDQPYLAHAIRKLFDMGLITKRRRGKYLHYYLDKSQYEAFSNLLNQINEFADKTKAKVSERSACPS